MFAARARVLLAVKMDHFLFLPRCFRLRIKMWVTAGYAEIGAKPQVTSEIPFARYLMLDATCRERTAHTAAHLGVEVLMF